MRLKTYNFAEDSAGQAVGEAMQRAARRGAKVRMMVDGFGSRDLSTAFIEALRAAGVIVQFFSLAYLSALIFGGAHLAMQFRRRQRLSAAATGGVGGLFVGFGVKMAGATLG